MGHLRGLGAPWGSWVHALPGLGHRLVLDSGLVLWVACWRGPVGEGRCSAVGFDCRSLVGTEGVKGRGERMAIPGGYLLYAHPRRFYHQFCSFEHLWSTAWSRALCSFQSTLVLFYFEHLRTNELIDFDLLALGYHTPYAYFVHRKVESDFQKSKNTRGPFRLLATGSLLFSRTLGSQRRR